MSQPVRRQSRPPAQEDWGIAIPFFAGAMILVTFSCWPAFFWHGYTDTGGWRWDIHSTIGCCAWWGILALSAFLYWADHRPGKTAPKPKRERSWPPPKYVPPRPGPDPAVTMRLLERLDAIDEFAAEAEKARTGEELDHLIVHGRLPGQERNQP